jgi:hypothetical protein
MCIQGEKLEKNCILEYMTIRWQFTISRNVLDCPAFHSTEQ